MNLKIKVVSDEKIMELLSRDDTLKIGLTLLIMTMGDPVRDYELFSSEKIHTDIKVTLFSAVYGTRLCRTKWDWKDIGKQLSILEPRSKTWFRNRFQYRTPTDTISDRECLYNALCELLLDTQEDMLAGKIPQCLLHILKN
jgi:hypothetical protein